MFSVTQEKYRRCQRWFDRWYPDYHNAGQLYQDAVEEHVDARTRALDLGCGRSSLASQQMHSTPFTAGIDASFPDLQANQSLHYPILGMAEMLPFADAAFDVLLSQWMVEHLPHPGLVFDEMARVLKPGGTAILLTTNARNYVPLLSKIVPAHVQGRVLESFLHRPRRESFPTYYRGNTCSAISKLAHRAGLVTQQCSYSGNPFYLAFSPLLFWGALLFERLTDFPPLRCLKLYIVATLKKPKLCS